MLRPQNAKMLVKNPKTKSLENPENLLKRDL